MCPAINAVGFIYLRATPQEVGIKEIERDRFREADFRDLMGTSTGKRLYGRASIAKMPVKH